MPRAFLLRALIVCHRWLGLVFCLLFTSWFASGIVLMYWEYPDVGSEDRLRNAEPIDAAKIQLSPIEAWGQLKILGQPDRAELSTFLGRPAYAFTIESERMLVYADDGSTLTQYSQETARTVAAQWTHQPAANARFDGEMRLPNVDQWTVGGPAAHYWPLFKFSWPTGESVYVSSTSGEVMQYTTNGSRVAAYLGAVPHWLYFVPLRRSAVRWQRFVLWSSGTGIVVSLLGIFVGFWMYSPRQIYRASGKPSSFPYSGQKRWHTILGLFFGLVTCTWAFSGFLSMGPIRALQRPPADAGKLVGALRGGALNLLAFRAKDPREALDEIGGELKVRELEFSVFGGEPLYLAREAPNQSRIVPVNFKAAPFFDPEIIASVIAEGIAPTKIAKSELINDYDAYYLDREHQQPLPVLRLRLDDAQRSAFYIDPKTARVVSAYSAEGRWNRWLYHGLHSLDFPVLYRYRPLWDVVMLVLLLGGTALSVTAVTIGWQFLRAKVK